jgi:hypothetical protein
MEKEGIRRLFGSSIRLPTCQNQNGHPTVPLRHGYISFGDQCTGERSSLLQDQRCPRGI